VSTSKDSRAPLEADDLAARLSAAGIDWPSPVVLASTGSTNDDVEELVAEGAPEGTCVVADEQTHGRGRLDRTWVSPPGAGLWTSVLVRPGDQPVERLALLSLVAGLAASDALAESCKVRAELKWPNDVVVVAAACGGGDGGGYRKLGGILSHAVSTDAVVIGIGINVSMTGEELPVKQASSVFLEGGIPDRAGLLVALLGSLRVRLAQWRAGDEQLMVDYRHRCRTIGRLVDVDLPNGQKLSGIVAGVDDSGHLLVSDGESTAIVTAGDVVHASI
jgi:BirA family biotin operon repressor/biotin-[acetyl-CoA-carboxylase] ligase